MAGVRSMLGSAVGTKFLVAGSGTVLAVFVFVHMLGNLQIYLGPDALNSYAAAIHAAWPLLWIARTVLLLALLVHIWGLSSLSHRNQAAGSTSYAAKNPLRSTFASRHMLMTGLVLFAFVVYHLLRFTAGLTHPEHFQMYDSYGRHDVYSMVILGFREPVVSLSYIAAMALLGLHLGHGVGSVLRSTGISGSWSRERLSGLGRLLAVVVVAGNVSIPLACLLGLMQPINDVL